MEKDQQIEVLQNTCDDLIEKLDQPFAERLKLVKSDDLSGMFEDWLRELDRRRKGGRQTRIGRTLTFGD